MAFQTGSQVRPELGRADLSGFARAGESIGAALASVGKSVGEGIEKYQTNKDVTLAGLASLEGQVAAEPTLVPALKNAGGAVGKAYARIESGDYNQRDVLTANGFATAYNQQKQATQASQISDLQLRAAQSEQEQKEISRSAFDMALSASRDAGTGEIDPAALSAAYFDQGGRDPNDLKIIESMQKMKGPNIDVIDIGGFTVVTQDGRYMTASRNGEAPTPAALQTLEGELAQLQRARQLYNEGDEVAANDILAILNRFKDLSGSPKPASEVFGPRKNTDDSSDLEDAVLSNQATTDNLPTPEEIETFNQAFLKPNP
jgi:hypothetical protein